MKNLLGRGNKVSTTQKGKYPWTFCLYWEERKCNLNWNVEGHPFQHSNFVLSIFSYECEMVLELPECSDRVDGAKASLISPRPATEYSIMIG